jgi:hypothetical protein
MLLDYTNLGRHSYVWIDSDTMQAVDVWFSELNGDTAISDRAVVTVWQPPRRSTLMELSERGRSWRLVCSASLECGGTPQFINEEVLAVTAPYTFKIIRTDGTVLFRQDFQYGKEGVGNIRPLGPAIGGGRLAVPIFNTKGGSTLLDIAGRSVPNRIAALDLAAYEWVYVLNCKKQMIRQLSGLAISPSGALLALLTEHRVEVYRLPTSSGTSALKK